MRNWKDVRDEIAEHAEDVRQEALRRGHPAEEANRLAQAELLQLEALAERFQNRRWWIGTRLDIAHAWRLLTRQRSYSVLVVATLAIGIGSCTAVYSLFHALLLQPLPFPNPDRLVLLWETDANDPSVTFIASAPNYMDWVANTRSFASLGIWSETTFNVSATSEPEQVSGLRASSSLFSVLGIAPQVGRVFSAAEETPGHDVAVISDAVWKVHLAGRRDIIGQPIRLNGVIHEVVGVMPPGFEFPYRGAGIWVPLALTQQDQARGAHSFWVAGRLENAVSVEQARDEVERLGAELRARYTENAGEGATVLPMAEYGVRHTRRILVALSTAAAMVLAIACVNVAGLQLALGLARRREFLTRLSLGATYARICRQVTVEALVIATVSCVIGVAVAWSATHVVELLLPAGFLNVLFRGDVHVSLAPGALTFAVSVAGFSALAFGYAPLVGLRRTSMPGAREGGRSTTRVAATTRRVLVGAEIALAVVVLSSAGLMTKSLAALLSVDPGIDGRDVLTMRVSLPQDDTYGRPQRVTFCQRLADETRSVPGLTRVSAVSHLPLSGANASRAITIEDRPEPGQTDGATANYRLTCPGYFHALGIALIAGRDFTDADVVGRDDVVIVSRALVDRYWPDGQALGHRIKIGGFRSTNPWMTIVGISENVRHFGLDSPPAREIFRPYAQAAWPVMTVVAKTAGAPLAWDRPLRSALARVESNLPAAAVRTMDDVVRQSVRWREAPMRLLSTFALVGLLLAAVGVYGVLAYYVSQRTREFGVRAALGASKRTLTTLVIRQSLWPLTIGLMLGLLGSTFASRLLAELLFDVRPGDPVVLAGVVATLIVVALTSSWWPARRAASIDPITALRED